MSDPKSRAHAGRLGLRHALLVPGAACALCLAGCNPISALGPLAPQWTTNLPSSVASKAGVSRGSVLVGGFANGVEYSLSEATGGVNWQTNLGTTTGFCPEPQTQGIASSPTVLGGSAYLGGGDANWYALDTSTGAVQWSIPVGDNSASGGNFNYASPLVYNGYGYVGTASFCDNPLVQGKLMKVDLHSHQVVSTWKSVPEGQVGGTIWTTPVVDPTTNTVFVTTGTRADPSQQNAEAFVGLDATTLAVKGAWSPTATNCNTCDDDFGASPTLFTDGNGRQLVGAVNKNGTFYALDRNNLSAGAVWQTPIASGGPCPGCGNGSISTAYFDGRFVYVAGGTTTLGGEVFRGSVRALDPTTGRVAWAVGLPGTVLGSLTGQAGTVAVPALTGLYVLNGADGRILYANDLGSQILASPTLADGELFLGTIDGGVHALRYPTPAAASSPGLAAASDAGRARICAIGAACRITVDRRCLGLRLPSNPPILGVHARIRGRYRGGDALRIYGNGACAGAPLLRLGFARGRAQLRSPAPLGTPAGMGYGVIGSRRLTLDVRLLRGRAPRRAVHLQGLPAVLRGSRP